MKRLIPAIPAFEDDRSYRKSRRRSDVWLPAIRHICLTHDLPTCSLTQINDGSHITFRAGQTHVIKLSPDAEMEEVMLRRLEGYLPVGIPSVVASGRLEGWPYVAMSQVEGTRLDHIWHTLDLQNKKTIVVELAALIIKLQEFPVEGLDDLERFKTLDAHQIGLLAGQLRDGGLAEHLVAEVPAYFEAAAPLYPDGTHPSLVLCDIQPEHLFCTERANEWRITGMVDFADASLAPKEHELGTPIINLMAGNEEVIETFLRAYGYKSTDLGAPLARRLTALFLYEPGLWLMLAHFPKGTPDALEEVQKILFPFS